MRFLVIYFILLIGCHTQTADPKSASGESKGKESAAAMERLILYVIFNLKQEYINSNQSTDSLSLIEKRRDELLTMVEDIAAIKNSPYWRRLSSVSYVEFDKNISEWKFSNLKWKSAQDGVDIFNPDNSGSTEITIELLDAFLKAHENEVVEEQTTAKNNEITLDIFRKIPEQITKDKLADLARTEDKRLRDMQIRDEESEQEKEKKEARDELLKYIRAVAKKQRNIIKNEMIAILAEKAEKSSWAEEGNGWSAQSMRGVIEDLVTRENIWEEILDKAYDRQPIPEYEEGEDVSLPVEVEEQNKRWWAVNSEIIELLVKADLLELASQIRENAEEIFGEEETEEGEILTAEAKEDVQYAVNVVKKQLPIESNIDKIEQTSGRLSSHIPKIVKENVKYTFVGAASICKRIFYNPVTKFVFGWLRRPSASQDEDE